MGPWPGVELMQSMGLQRVVHGLVTEQQYRSDTSFPGSNKECHKGWELWVKLKDLYIFFKLPCWTKDCQQKISAM